MSRRNRLGSVEAYPAPASAARSAAAPAMIAAILIACAFALAAGASRAWAITVTTPDAGRGPHASYNQPTALCARCHQVHTGVTRRFLRGYWNGGASMAATEEGTCYTCHDGTGTGTNMVSTYNIRAQFQKAYAMPITTSVNVHIGREPTSATFTGTTRDPVGPSTRHVECIDCHNPHVDRGKNHMHPNQPFSAPSNDASAKLAGVWGVTVAYGSNTWGSWSAPFFNTSDVYSPVAPDIQKEWQLCFKCHSAYSYAFDPPTSPSFLLGNNVPGSPTYNNDETDQSKEFNTANDSYHPVVGAGKNDFKAFVGGVTVDYSAQLRDMTTDSNGALTPTSTIYCSDCHRKNSTDTSDVMGPHGSTNPFILIGRWDGNICFSGGDATCSTPYSTETAAASNDVYGKHPVLCFNCHDRNTFTGGNCNTGFSTGNCGTNLHEWHLTLRNRDKMGGDAPITCMSCHSGVPHGYDTTISGKTRRHLLVARDDPYPYRTSKSRLKTSDLWDEATDYEKNYTESVCNNTMFDGGDGAVCK